MELLSFNNNNDNNNNCIKAVPTVPTIVISVFMLVAAANPHDESSSWLYHHVYKDIAKELHTIYNNN